MNFKILFSTFLLLCSNIIFAHDIVVDDIYYNITSSTEMTVEVTYKGTRSEAYNEYSGDVKIPTEIIYEGEIYRVTSISREAFRKCADLSSVIIPNSVTRMGDYVFQACSNIGSIIIPNNVVSIGNYAFSGCSSLTSIDLPDGITSIGNYAFNDCSCLTSIDLPDGITSIGNSAFSGCSSLTSIDLPDGITSIGNSAFSGCESLESIIIPQKVKSIEFSSFENCLSLTSVYIPEGVVSIGDFAFVGCSELTINIPNSVTSIGQFAFCSELKTVSSKILEPFVVDAFCDFNATLIVPKGTRGAYKKTEGWHFPIIYEDGETIYDYISKQTDEQGVSYTLMPDSDGSLYYSVTGHTNTMIENVAIPADIEGCPVRSIEELAFKDCKTLTSIILPNSLSSIGDGAFYDCI